MKFGHEVGFDLGSYGGYQAIQVDKKIKFSMEHLNQEKMETQLATRYLYLLSLCHIV